MKEGTNPLLFFKPFITYFNFKTYIMEFIISPAKMKQLMETSDDTIKLFISTPRDKEIVEGIKTMESMSVRTVEVDLSEDDKKLL
jgi:exoribonuclease II